MWKHVMFVRNINCEGDFVANFNLVFQTRLWNIQKSLIWVWDAGFVWSFKSFPFHSSGFSFFDSWSLLPLVSISSAFISSRDKSLISCPNRDKSSFSLRRPVATSRSSSTSCVACKRKCQVGSCFGTTEERRRTIWNLLAGRTRGWFLSPWRPSPGLPRLLQGPKHPRHAVGGLVVGARASCEYGIKHRGWICHQNDSMKQTNSFFQIQNFSNYQDKSLYLGTGTGQSHKL